MEKKIHEFEFSIFLWFLNNTLLCMFFATILNMSLSLSNTNTTNVAYRRPLTLSTFVESNTETKKMYNDK